MSLYDPEVITHKVSEIESNSPSEDRFDTFSSANFSAWAVIDGHGGVEACDIVKNILIQYIYEKLIACDSIDDPETVSSIIDASFQKCDEAVLQEALKKVRIEITDPVEINGDVTSKVNLSKVREAGRPGCCAIIVIIVGKYIYAANLG